MKPGVRRATLEQVHAGSHRLPAGVHLQDHVPAGEVGRLDADLPVEPAGSQQRGVEDVGSVGRGDQDHPAAHVEAVHLHEQLVEGLLPLVVSAAHAGSAVPADGVDLVDEDDRRGVLLGLLEQVAHPGGPDADEHLHEVRPGDRVEGHPCLAGDGAGEQRLAGAGGAVEQHALGDLGADGLELRGLLEELLDLAELLDRLLAPGDVGERRLGHVLADQLGLGLGELHDPAAAALHLVHQEQEQQDDQQEGQERGQDRAQQARLGHLDVDLVDLAVLHALDRLRVQLALRPVHPRRGDLLAVPQLGADLLVTVDEQDRLGLPAVDVLLHLRGVDLVVPAVGREVLQRDEDTHHRDDDPHPGTAENTLHIHVSGLPPRPPARSNHSRHLDGTRQRPMVLTSGLHSSCQRLVGPHCPADRRIGPHRCRIQEYTCGASVPIERRLR